MTQLSEQAQSYSVNAVALANGVTAAGPDSLGTRNSYKANAASFEADLGIASADGGAQNAVIGALVAISVLLSLFSSAAPTTIGWWNTFLCGLFAALGAYLSGFAARFTLVAVATICAVEFALAARFFPLVLSIVAIGITFFALRYRKPSPILSTTVGVLVFNLVLHFGAGSLGVTPAFFAFTALLGAMISAVIFFDALARLPHKQRFALGVATLIGLLLGVVIVGAATFGLLSARSHAIEAVGHASTAKSAAVKGDLNGAITAFRESQQALEAANRASSSVLVKPLALIPIASQNYAFAGTALAEAALLVSSFEEVVSEVQTSELASPATVGSGSNIQRHVELLARLSAPLGSTRDQFARSALKTMAFSSPWLIGPLAKLAEDAQGQLPALQNKVDATVAAISQAPEILGANAPRNYLLLIGSPGETRELGGFLGSFSHVRLAEGDISLGRSGRSFYIRDLQKPDLEALDFYRYPVDFINSKPIQHPQNLTNTPSIEVVNQFVTETLILESGESFDGVVYIDPLVLQALLEVTGPVVVPGFDFTFESGNLLQFLYVHQYELSSDRTVVFDALGALAAQSIERLKKADTPTLARFAWRMLDLAQGGHFQAATNYESDLEALRQVGLSRSFYPEAGGDFLAVVQANATSSKLDLYLHRSMDYSVEISADGVLNAVLKVGFQMAIPEGAHPYTLASNTATPETNVILPALYSPFVVTEATLDGQALEFVVREEFGMYRYAFFDVAVKNNSTSNLVVKLAGEIPDIAENGYRLRIWNQPLVNEDLVTVAVNTQFGSYHEQFTLDSARRIRVIPEVGS